jgi:hypothetical protein
VYKHQAKKTQDRPLKKRDNSKTLFPMYFTSTMIYVPDGLSH